MFLRRAIGMRLDGVLSSCVVFRPSGVLGVLLLCVLVALTGCSSKNITSKGPFVLQEPSKGYPSVPSSSGQKTGTVYLPSDDGRPLTKAEQEAFLSEGEMDRNLSREEQGTFCSISNIWCIRIVIPSRRTSSARSCICRLFTRRCVQGDCRANWRMSRLSRADTTRWRLRAAGPRACGNLFRARASYGMEQDWWMDERRDPYQSTRATADYLDKLYKMFNDWHLAVYGLRGGRKDQRRARRYQHRTFFELRRKNEQIYSVRDRLSDENKQYLPKFLAVCKIVRNLDKLGFSLRDVRKFVADCGSQGQTGDGPHAVLKSIGMSWEFSAHNPAYQRYVSHPSRSTKIYVPRAMAGKAQALLFKLPPANSGKSYAGLRDYKISRGDTMASISRKTGVPVARNLRRINQVSEPLRAGRVLKRSPEPTGRASILARWHPVREVPSAKGRPLRPPGVKWPLSRTVSLPAPVREKVVSTASAHRTSESRVIPCTPLQSGTA